MTARDDSEIWDVFGLTDNLIGSFEHWTVMLRPKQVTPGSMVLILNRFATTMADLEPAEGAEFGPVCKTIESALRERLGMEKINYLALMMVDPHLHFHVIPRFSGPVSVGDRVHLDPAWPGPPDLSAPLDDPSLLPELRHTLRLTA